MPTVLRKNGFRFFFFSNEDNEPPHIHVQYQSGTAKFWLKPIRLASNDGLKQKDIKRAFDLIKENQKLLKEKWDEFFSQKIG